MQNMSKRSFFRYAFYKLSPDWRALPSEDRKSIKIEFSTVIEKYADQLVVKSYRLSGTRADVDFMLWIISPTLELLDELASSINTTELGKYLSMPYSYLSMSRRSSYIDDHSHSNQSSHKNNKTTFSPYLFVYPFVKSHEWYQLPKSDRQEIMTQHFEIGHKYPSVRISTSYSFGLDDQEFVLGFETNSPSDFLELVMELRESKARPYTLRDTPIFTCIYYPIEECLDGLG